MRVKAGESVRRILGNIQVIDKVHLGKDGGSGDRRWTEDQVCERQRTW